MKYRAGPAIAALALVLVCMGMSGSAEDRSKNPALKPFVSGSILFGAHRGGMKWRPEETLKTYQEAAETWPEIMLEGDAHITKDGVAVLMHDGRVNRTTCAEGPISEMTLEELKTLDAGCRFTLDGGETFPYRGAGYRIPTLLEVLQALPDTYFMIELKDQDGVAGPVVRAIQQAGAVDRVVLASFRSGLMDEAKALEPKIATCFSASTLIRLAGALQGDAWDAYVREDDVLAMNYHSLSRYRMTVDDFPRIQAKGIRICLYNINDPAEIRELLDRGVDSMLTDVPGVFAQALAEWRAENE